MAANRRPQILEQGRGCLRMEQYRSVQYLRGIAAMMVVYFHFMMQLARNGAGVLPDAIKLGAAGVDVFFVISGFIMWVTTYETRLRPGEFWIRRFVRIAPLYWSFTVLLAVLAVVAPAATRTQVDPGHLVTSLLFIPDSHPFKDGKVWPLLVPGWSLNFEIYFYLVLGAFLLLARQIRLWGLSCFFVMVVLTGQLLQFVNPIAAAYTSPIVLEFLMGMAIGQLVIRGKTAPAPVAVLLIVLAAIIFVANAYSEPGPVNRLFVWGTPSFFLVYAFVSLEKNGWRFENRIMLALGASSYSLYLSHMFTLGAISFIWSRINITSVYLDVVMHPVALAVCGIAGYVAYKFYEKPLLRVTRRWTPFHAKRAGIPDTRIETRSVIGKL